MNLLPQKLLLHWDLRKDPGNLLLYTKEIQGGQRKFGKIKVSSSFLPITKGHVLTVLRGHLKTPTYQSNNRNNQ